MSLHKQGKLEEAESAYQAFLDVNPDHPQALRLSGILARELGQLVKSVTRLSHLSELLAHDPAPFSELGLTHMTAGNLGAADACFREALSRDTSFYRAIANRGALLQRRGHVMEAIEMYRRCIELEPDDLEIRCNLASAMMEAGMGDEALDQCNRALSIDPDNPLVLAAQGGVHCGLQKFDPARKILERVVSSGVIDEMVLINLAFSCSRLGDIDAAIENLLQAVAVFPDNARAFADLANAWSAAGQIDKALDVCEDFLARYPGERQVLACYAYALRDAGRIDEANAILDFDHLIHVHDITAPAGYESVVSFNNSLAAFIQAHSSLLANPVRKATVAGLQTGELDATDSAELGAFAGLVDGIVKETIQKYQAAGFSDHPAVAGLANSWTLRIWANVLRSGGQQAPHLHPLAWLSGVYYVQLPHELPSRGGLAFGAPPAHLTFECPPEEYAIEPRNGRLVVFPSCFYHCTQPFVSEQPRISIAFDVIPGR